MRSLSILTTLTVCLLALTACGANGAEKMEEPALVSLLMADRFCGPRAGATLITEASQQDQQPMAVAQAMGRTALDWSQRQLLLLNMGQQPSLGYSLDYRTGARLERDTLVIPIQWNTPQPGMMQAQMLVEPCLLLSIPRHGYTRIDVQDQTGRLRWSLVN